MPITSDPITKEISHAGESTVISPLLAKMLNLNVIFSFCREIIDEKKKFCLVTNPRNKLIY